MKELWFIGIVCWLIALVSLAIRDWSPVWFAGMIAFLGLIVFDAFIEGNLK